MMEPIFIPRHEKDEEKGVTHEGARKGQKSGSTVKLTLGSSADLALHFPFKSICICSPAHLRVSSYACVAACTDTLPGNPPERG